MTFTVFLPNCMNDACNRNLREVSNRLRDEKCNVVTNKINGTYKNNLMGQFKSSTLTILHQCSDLWKQMKSNGVRLRELKPVEKLMCVKISNIDTPLTVKEETSFAKFFLSFNVQAVSDAESLEGFVDKVKQYRDEWLSTTRETTRLLKSGNCEAELLNVDEEILQTLVKMKNDEELKNKEHGVRYVRYPEEDSSKEENYVFVLVPNSLFNKAHQINYEKIKSLDEFYKQLKQLSRSPEVFEANLEFIHNKILPTFLKFKAIHGLSKIAAICKQRQIQERCFLYLKLLLLQEDEITCSYNTLQEVQIKLTKVMKYLRTECPKGGDQFTDSSIRRLCQTIVMIEVHKYLHYKKKDSSSSDENFRKKIKSFLTECNKFGDNDAHIATALQFLTEAPDKLQIMIAEQLSKKREKNLLNICGSKIFSSLFIPSPKQIVCVIGFLKQLFLGTNSTRKELLDSCLEKILSSKVNMDPVVSSMFKDGVVMFLTHGIKDISHQHFQEICDKGLKLLKSFLSKELQEEMCHDLSALLFSNVPTIRQKVIEMLFESNIYYKCQKPFLALEVLHKLAPLLQIEDKTIPKFVEKEHHEGWFSLCAEFSHKPAGVIAHCPSASSHHTFNHTEFGQDCAYKNQLDMLKSLKHDNIIQLFAFHMRSNPQFYIIEAHANFKEMLCLKNINKAYYSASSLHTFVIDAAEAIEYCHQCDIILANIRAKSFVVTDACRLKLSDLGSARKLSGPSEMSIPASSLVPVRWCSPETLKRLKISFKSDYWMFGCLMEEILTHGAPPNSHTRCDDETYVNQVYEHTMQLHKEKCINDQHFQIIKMCMQQDPNQRLSISQAIYQLKQVDQGRIPTEKPSYPNLEKEKHIFASDLKPVSLFQTYCNFGSSSTPARRILSGNLTEHTLGCRVFVTELLQAYPLSMEVQDKIKKGALDPILPKVDVTNAVGAQCIEVYLPSSCEENVLDFLSKNQLATVEAIIVPLLTKMIDMLQLFSDNGLVLGDFKLSTIYVFNYQNESSDISVHPVSLGRVEVYSSSSEGTVKKKTEDISPKSNPQKSVQNKASSDVFVFGKFLEELIQVIHSNENIYETVAYSQHAGIDEAGPVWLQNIAVLMKKCIHIDPLKRPNLAEIKSRLLQLHTRSEKINPQDSAQPCEVVAKPTRPLPPLPDDEEPQIDSYACANKTTQTEIHRKSHFRANPTKQTELSPELTISIEQKKINETQNYVYSKIKKPHCKESPSPPHLSIKQPSKGSPTNSNIGRIHHANKHVCLDDTFKGAQGSNSSTNKSEKVAHPLTHQNAPARKRQFAISEIIEHEDTATLNKCVQQGDINNYDYYFKGFSSCSDISNSPVFEYQF